MADTDQQPIPDAQTETPAMPELRLGEPFAISYGCDLVEAKEQAGAGCSAVVRCDCNQMFRVNLLDGEVKYCPACNAGFTHALLVSPLHDTQIVTATMHVVMEQNGIVVEGDEGDDEGDEGDDEGEGEGDEGEGDAGDEVRDGAG